MKRITNLIIAIGLISLASCSTAKRSTMVMENQKNLLGEDYYDNQVIMSLHPSPSAKIPFGSLRRTNEAKITQKGKAKIKQDDLWIYAVLKKGEEGQIDSVVRNKFENITALRVKYITNSNETIHIWWHRVGTKGRHFYQCNASAKLLMGGDSVKRVSPNTLLEWKYSKKRKTRYKMIKVKSPFNKAGIGPATPIRKEEED